jgi:hypothetical protein
MREVNDLKGINLISVFKEQIEDRLGNLIVCQVDISHALQRIDHLLESLAV